MATQIIEGATFTDEDQERFWSKVDKRDANGCIDEDGCWIWTGAALGTGGYGGTQRGANRLYAHRVAYALTKGPIQKGLVVRHGPCDLSSRSGRSGNKRCVNPDHLAIGTHADNLADEREGWFRLELEEIPMPAARREGTQDFLTLLREEDATRAAKQDGAAGPPD